MEFFNKKEEVIDLRLTQFGRYLLSKGKLNPKFYSFFDDDVMYDAEKAGISEPQNESEKRIQNETPTMHHQVSFSSLEKEFNNNYNKVLSGESTAFSKDVQRSAEKHFALPQPIGTSKFDSEFSPSWSVQFLNGAISGTVDYINLSEKNGGRNTQIVPQIPTGMLVRMIDVSDSSENEEEMEDGFADSNFVLESDEDDVFILLKIEENNGLFQKKNFDIELFEIEEEVQDGVKIEKFSFSSLADVSVIVPADNVVVVKTPAELNDATSEVSFLDDADPEVDQDSVAHYFDIFVDEEIDSELLCEYDPVNENKGVYSDPRTKYCQDVLNQKKKKVFDIYSDEEDTPGEIC